MRSRGSDSSSAWLTLVASSSSRQSFVVMKTAVEAGVVQALADLGFVAVHPRGVDVAVAELERVANGDLAVDR